MARFIVPIASIPSGSYARCILPGTDRSFRLVVCNSVIWEYSANNVGCLTYADGTRILYSTGVGPIAGWEVFEYIDTL